MSVILKTEKEIELMRQSGKILSEIIHQIADKAEPGLPTIELDKLAEKLIFNYGAKPGFKNYQGFPNSLCVSINEQIVHGVPLDRKIKEGDILSLDLGLIYPASSAGKQGYYSDMALTLAIGSVDPEANRLIRVTKKSLKRAIKRCKPDKTLGDLGHAIQTYVQDQGFQVVRDLCGHGIGKNLHESPEVLNFGQRHKGLKLESGMVLAIEPMVVMGQPGIKKGADGFCYQTADNSLSAHFEHTVAITDKGPKILTE